MARERITLDVFELAELLRDFLIEGEVSIAGVELTTRDEELGGNDTISKVFAEYAMKWRKDGRYSPSPLDAVFSFGALLNRVKLKSEPASRLSLSDDHNVYYCMVNDYPEFLTSDARRDVELYLHGWSVEFDLAEATESYEQGLVDGVKSLYENRRKEAQVAISAPKLRMLIMERDGAKCRWCGETEGLALDHILPVVAGGTDDPENLQVLCGSCNSSKGDRVPSQFKEEV